MIDTFLYFVVGGFFHQDMHRSERHPNPGGSNKISPLNQTHDNIIRIVCFPRVIKVISGGKSSRGRPWWVSLLFFCGCCDIFNKVWSGGSLVVVGSFRQERLPNLTGTK